MNVEMAHLRAFVAVVDHGSFTDAASSLHLSQAAVSRAIASLESAIGARVLHRTTREVGLTLVGARIIGPARTILDEAAYVMHAAEHDHADFRVGYSWAALGKHTTSVQRRWATEFPGTDIVFVQSLTSDAALVEGTVDVVVARRPMSHPRLTTALAGVESRFAAVAIGDVLARRRTVTLDDFAGRVVAIDDRTGTTTPGLWTTGAAPSSVRIVHGVEDWLTVIAAGQAIGITAEATLHQHPRPGVRFRPVRDAEPIPVWIAWRSDAPPDRVGAFVRMVCEAYGVEHLGQPIVESSRADGSDPSRQPHVHP